MTGISDAQLSSVWMAIEEALLKKEGAGDLAAGLGYIQGAGGDNCHDVARAAIDAYRRLTMGRVSILPTDTHVLHVGIAASDPGKIIFVVERADTREPLAWVLLSPEHAIEVTDSIPRLIEEMRQRNADRV